MHQTLFRVFQWPSWKILRYTDPELCGAWCDHNDLIWNYFCDGDYNDVNKCKGRFFQHNERVREVVPKERLLEYDIKQGWEPVTSFLGLPEFTGTVKRNTTSEFLQYHEMIWKLILIRSGKNLAKSSLVLSALVGILAYSISRLGWIQID